MKSPLRRTALVFVTSTLIACTSGDAAEPSTPSTSDGTPPTVDTTPSPGTDAPGPDTGTSTEPVDPSNLPLCRPAPAPGTARIDIDLFATVIDVESRGCYLEQLEITGVSSSVQSYAAPDEQTCDDQGICTTELPRVALAWSQTSEYDLGLGRIELYKGLITGRRVAQNNVETLEVTLDIEISGSTAARRVERTYTDSGDLLFERYSFGSSTWFEVDNTWQDGQLVTSTRHDFINRPGTSTQTTWSYDAAGRLVATTTTSPDGDVNDATFGYDDADRVVRLTRSYNEAEWLAQTWNYQGDALISRTSRYSPDRIWQRSADTFELESAHDYMSHWSQATFQHRGDCTMPPLSMSHGYPDEERVYHLGWGLNDVPNGIGFAYGYDGYGWNYGDLSWYGHDGIASSYGLDRAFRSDVSVEIRYSGGVMVEELATFTTTTLEGSDALTSLVRSRVFDGNQLTEDEVLLTTTANETTTSRAKTLRFTHNDLDLPIERQRYSDDTYLHLSTWDYSNAGLITEHAVYGNNPYIDETTESDLDNTTLPHRATYRQTETQEDGTYRRVRERLNGEDGSWTTVDTYERGSHPRGTYEARDRRFMVYDEQDRAVMDGSGSPLDPDYYHAWRDDTHGLLAEWEAVGGEGLVTETYRHTCAAPRARE